MHLPNHSSGAGIFGSLHRIARTRTGIFGSLLILIKTRSKSCQHIYVYIYIYIYIYIYTYIYIYIYIYTSYIYIYILTITSSLHSGQLLVLTNLTSLVVLLTNLDQSRSTLSVTSTACNPMICRSSNVRNLPSNLRDDLFAFAGLGKQHDFKASRWRATRMSQEAGRRKEAEEAGRRKEDHK